MAFRSIFDHVSSAYNTTILKNRITSFFSNCRRKIVLKQHQLAGAKANLKQILQFQNLFSPIQKHRVYTKAEDATFEKLQVVAKSLAVALTANTLYSTTTALVLHCEKVEDHPVQVDDMTISEDTILEIRDDYPDLDAEIRSILLARAQEGATVSEIKQDYYDLTGEKFPIRGDIVPYLLSIPLIHVYRNEQGTLIFNVKANEKTKHIYNLVMQQKPGSICGSYHGDEELNIQPSSVWRRVTNNDEVPVVQPSFEGRSTDVPFPFEQSQQNDCNNINYDNNNNVTAIDPIHRQLNGHSAMYSPQTQLQAEPFTRQHAQTYITGHIEPAYHLRAQNSYQNNRNYMYNRIHNNSKALQENDLIHNNNYNNRRTRNRSRNFPGIAATRSPSSSQLSTSHYPVYSDYQAHLWNFPLLGDDFFMYLARMELNCKFKRNQRILQSGFCISGQTIGDAIRYARLMNHRKERIIVNIGSVDIMQDKPLVQIEHQLRELIDVLLEKGVTPILTTLGPLANYGHMPLVKAKLQRFNEFIKNEAEKQFLQVIDVWSCLVNERKQTLFDCFQREPRMVTGSSKPHQFWNKVGRQRVLQLVESSLEY